MDVTIKQVSEETINDFCHFFDDVAFTDNKDWAGCYCFFYHFDDSNVEFESRDAAANRTSAIEYIKEGKMTGYLAYLGNEPIGWCNVNSKKNYARISLNTEIASEDDDNIASIVCFTIAPEHRGIGIATKLLERICSDYSSKGYEYIEAYPRKGNLTNAQHYHGTMSMYAKRGFVLYKELDGYDIVRKKL